MAERRWCLTGTPVQNKLDDLFSLTQFLRFHPLENHSNARKYILEPLGRQDKSAVTNLRLAMQTIALRRMKNASTSKRRDKIVIEIELSPRERQHYVSVRDRMRQLTLDSKTPQSHALLLCILYLRQLCSHGKPSLSPAPSRHMSENPHAGTPFCNKCGDLISVNPKSADQESRTCGHKVCAECRLEEKSIIDGDSNSFALLLQCCVCQEPITSGTPKGKELNDQTLKSLLGDNSSEMLDASSNPRFSSKIQGVVDKLMELNSEINTETGEPVKR
jgi:SNF2 family DNA or RNA helicase